MKWFLDLRIGAKLLVGFVAMAAIVALVGLSGLKNSGIMHDRFQGLFDDNLAMTHDAGAMAEAYNHSRVVRFEMLGSLESGSAYAEFKGKLRNDLATVNEQVDRTSRTAPTRTRSGS